MSKSRFVFDKFAKFLEEGLVNYKDFSDEVVNILRSKKEEIILKMNLVSKDEIDVIEANRLINEEYVDWILLTSSNLPARLISKDGVLEITPPDFKTINSTGAGDATAAYIGAFGVENLIENVKGACASGAIVAGTNELPTMEKIKEVSELIEIKPR